jgi:hypothetical protein
MGGVAELAVLLAVPSVGRLRGACIHAGLTTEVLWHAFIASRPTRALVLAC